MKLRTLIAAACLLIAAIAISVITVFRTWQPVYHGHGISYWIEPWQHHGTEPEANIEAAFNEMDGRAVRWLMRELEWHPSAVVETLNHLVNKVISARFFNDKPDRREVAAMALGRLGTRAKEAAPALEHLFQNAAEPRAWSSRAAALGALIRIRNESLEPYLEKLRDAKSPDWPVYAAAMAHLGTNAAPAVPLLARTTEQTTNQWFVHVSVSALASIRSHSELTVPALAVQLKHPSSQVRYRAVWGLSCFGNEAKSAWPDLVGRLNDSDVSVRVATTNALRRIDAAGASQVLGGNAD